MTISKTIENIINADDYNTIYTAKDFLYLTSYNNAKLILSRLCNKSIIQRLVDGMYYKAKYSNIVDDFIPVPVYTFVNKLADIYEWNICVYGEAALNYLGLSTQVPAHYIFVSDGPYREYELYGIKIKFKHTNTKNIKNLSFKVGTIIEALKYLGDDNITNDNINILKKNINNEEKEELIKIKKKLPVWLNNYIERIISND